MTAILIDRLGFGPLLGTPWTFSKADLTTTWVNVPLPGSAGVSPQQPGGRYLPNGDQIKGLHVLVTNRSSSNTAAISKTQAPTISPASLSPAVTFPTFSTSDATIETGFVPIAANFGFQLFAITDLSMGLWIIGSAAATDVVVNFFVET